MGPGEARGGLGKGPDGKTRCWWCLDHDDYIDYHDNEWGNPVADDHRLFEKICLEGFQAGLSWLTILRKRENFREAFSKFDFDRVARFNARSVERLMKNPGIVRHRGKIESTINNARRARELVEEFGSLSVYFWSWEPEADSRPPRLNYEAAMSMTKSPESIALSKDLKKRGWSFVGPTTVYAFMQSMGMVNDHLEGCSIRMKIESQRRSFERPS